MIALTSDMWSGLRLYRCGHDGEVRHLHLDIDTPRLVLWSSGGTDVVVHRGRSRCRCFLARPGRFDFYAAGSFDEIRVGPMLEDVLVVEVPDTWLGGADARRRAPATSRFQFSDRPLKILVQALLAHGAQAEPLGSQYTQALSFAIAGRLAELHMATIERTRPPPLAPSQRRRVDELLEAQLGSPPQVATLAQIVGMSDRQFLRAFKAEFGDSLHQYVLRRRIERAKELLVSDGQSLTDLALDLGFASHAHFTMAFHARTGTTPSAFRHGGVLT